MVLGGGRSRNEDVFRPLEVRRLAGAWVEPGMQPSLWAVLEPILLELLHDERLLELLLGSQAGGDRPDRP